MQYKHQINGGALQVDISGRFTCDDNQSYHGIIKVMEEQNVKQVNINLQDLGFIDSAGLGMLMLTHEKAKEQGGSLSIMNANGQPEKMLKLARLDEVFG